MHSVIRSRCEYVIWAIVEAEMILLSSQLRTKCIRPPSRRPISFWRPWVSSPLAAISLRFSFASRGAAAAGAGRAGGVPKGR